MTSSSKRNPFVTAVPKYDTGWVANSDWTDAELTATHNLGLALDKLDVKFLVSIDGTDANSFEILSVNWTFSTSYIYGTIIYYVSDNEIKIQTGTDGIKIIQDDGTHLTLDTESWHYRIIVRAKDQYIVTKDRATHYSLSETLTGDYWIDGKPIYRKIIDFGALPNATSKNVAHGITGIDQVIPKFPLGVTNNGTDTFPIPFVSSSSLTTGIQIYNTATNIIVTTGSNRSAYTPTYIEIQYTKV